MTDPWKAAFARFLDAALPYLDEIVIAGGWASRLHRLSPHAVELDFAPLLTSDVDTATPSVLPKREQTLGERMIRYGFVEQLSTNFKPPVTRYTLEEPEGFEVEFVANLSGGYRKWGGTEDATVEVAGITAQKLHYVDLLLVRPWTVKLRPQDGYPMEAKVLNVRVPNPVSYIVQKLLIYKHRRNKAAKDVLYIHDTLKVFGDAEDKLREEWLNLHAKMPPKWRHRCRARSSQIGSSDCAHVVQAAGIARAAGRSLDADIIATVLRVGLIFLERE